MSRCGFQCGLTLACSPLGSRWSQFALATSSTKSRKLMRGRENTRDEYELCCTNLSRYAESSRSAGSRKKTAFVQLGSFMMCVAFSIGSCETSGLFERKCGSMRQRASPFSRRIMRIHSVHATFGIMHITSLCSAS